jgi:hypothetical protein
MGPSAQEVVGLERCSGADPDDTDIPPLAAVSPRAALRDDRTVNES